MQLEALALQGLAGKRSARTSVERCGVVWKPYAGESVLWWNVLWKPHQRSNLHLLVSTRHRLFLFHASTFATLLCACSLHRPQGQPTPSPTSPRHPPYLTVRMFSIACRATPDMLCSA